MTLQNDRGMALAVAVLTTLLVSALTAALVLTTSAETLISGAFGAAQQAMYAADAGAEWCIADLSAPGADWTAIAAGAVKSAFLDGPPSGSRSLRDGSAVDLGSVAAANPGWHLYAYGQLDTLLPDANRGTAFYVVAMATADGPSADRLKIRALAFGPRGAHNLIELGLRRVAGGVRVESWLETR